MKRLILLVMVLVSSLLIHAQEVEQDGANQAESSQLKVLLQESKTMQQQFSLAVKKSEKEQANFARKMAVAAKAHTVLKEKFAQLREERTLLKQELSLVKKENRERAKEYAQVSRKCTSVEKQGQKLDAQNARLNQELTLAKKEQEKLRADYVQACKTIDGTAQRYEKELSLALKEQADKLKTAENEYVKLDKERFALQEKCGESQQACRELEAQLEQQRGIFKQVQAEFKEHQKQAHDERSFFEKKCEQTQRELHATRNQQEKLQDLYESLKQAHATTVDENKVLCAQARNYDKTARDLHKTAEKSQKECEKLQKHLTVALDERSAISSHYKEKLAASQSQLHALSREHKKSLAQLAQIGAVRNKLESQLKEHVALNDIARDDMVAHFESQVKALDSLKKEKALAEREKRMLALKLEESNDAVSTLKNAFLAIKEQAKIDSANHKLAYNALKKELQGKNDEPRKLQATLNKKDARIAQLEKMYTSAMQKQKSGESLRVALMMRLKDQERSSSGHREMVNAPLFDIDEIMSQEIMTAAEDSAQQEEEIAHVCGQEEDSSMLAQSLPVSKEKIEAIIAKAPQAKQKINHVRSRRRRGSLWG